MSLSERSLHELALPLNPERVVPLPDGHPAAGMPYLPIDDVVSRANEIFGFGGWSTDLVGQPYLLAPGEADGKHEVWAAVVRVTIPATGASYTDIGTNARSGRGPAALEMSVKGAVSDGVKRCLVYLGDQFGLVLRDKEADRATLHAHWQAAMQRDGAAPAPAAKPAPRAAPAPADWDKRVKAALFARRLVGRDLTAVIPVTVEALRDQWATVVPQYMEQRGLTPEQLVESVVAQLETAHAAAKTVAAALPDDDAAPIPAAPTAGDDEDLGEQMARLSLGFADIALAIGKRQATPANVDAFLAEKRWSARELAEYAAEIKRRAAGVA